MMRRAALVSAALAAALTGAALPAAGTEPAPPDHAPAAAADSDPSPAPGGSAPPSQQPPASQPSASQPSTPDPSASQPSTSRPSTSSAPTSESPAGEPSTSTDARKLTDPAAPDVPADPKAPGAPGVPADQPSLVVGDPRDFGAQIFQGKAFDTCQAPSTATMRAWKDASPFGAAGIYIGGRGRACPQQKHLSPDWVTEVNRQGWKLMPIYVGSQAPCVVAKNKQKFRMSSKYPYAQGQREGQDAVRQAQRFHMAEKSALYLDMEAYHHKNKSCADTTLRFIQGWNSAVRAQGYVAGFYGSANSGAAHLETARAAGARGLPTAVWFARWHVPASTDDERNINPKAWQPHRRIHQHTGSSKRTYGGHTVTVDHNLVDAPVAVVG